MSQCDGLLARSLLKQPYACRHPLGSRNPLLALLPTKTNNESFTAGRQLNRAGQGCDRCARPYVETNWATARKGKGREDERLLDSLSESRQPCPYQQGRMPNANYIDEWHWLHIPLPAIYSLCDPNYQHTWRTKRAGCREKQSGGRQELHLWEKKKKNRMIWCLLTLPACIITISWRPQS